MDRSMTKKPYFRWPLVLAGVAALEGAAFAQTPQAPPQEESPPLAPSAPAAGALTVPAGPVAGEKVQESARTPPAAQPGAPAPASAAMAAATADGDGKPEEKASEPFAFGDFTWLNGNNRQHQALLDSPVFTGSFLLDVNYTSSLNHPIDNTVVGSTALARNNEFTLAFLGFGGDLHYKHARGRLMTQFGLRSTLVPRNDVSTNRGQFDMQTALRYISEAYGGYHFDVLHGVNLDVGIFMSYVGLFSYDNFENWMYLPSFTSDNTPWFFNGMRLQVFTSDKLKIEPWLINGWQSYGKFNEMPGFGAQILWRPTEWLSILSNDYVGWDTQNGAGRVRFHSDNSIQVKYLETPSSILSRGAFSITADIGGESGDVVTPFGGSGTEGHCSHDVPCTQQFMSWMAYNRLWFGPHLAWTTGGGMMHNPGRYLVLAPTGNASPFTQPLGVAAATQPFDYSPGSKFDAYDYATGIQFMPDEQQTIDLEFNHREANVPYFAGHGGVTSPDGYVTTKTPTGWRPDLTYGDARIILAYLLRF